MKTKEELNALKEEVETLKKKLAELSDEELRQVSGGIVSGFRGNQEPDQVSDVTFFGQFIIKPKNGNPELQSDFGV